MLPSTWRAIIIQTPCVVARLPHGRHPAGLRDLTADLKKVAWRNDLTPEGIRGGRSSLGRTKVSDGGVGHTALPTARIGDSDEGGRPALGKRGYNGSNAG